MKTRGSAEAITGANDTTILPLTVRAFILQLWLAEKQAGESRCISYESSKTGTIGQLGSERRLPVSEKSGVLSGNSLESLRSQIITEDGWSVFPGRPGFVIARLPLGAHFRQLRQILLEKKSKVACWLSMPTSRRTL
jgi:hypothetical protein